MSSWNISYRLENFNQYRLTTFLETLKPPKTEK